MGVAFHSDWCHRQPVTPPRYKHMTMQYYICRGSQMHPFWLPLIPHEFVWISILASSLLKRPLFSSTCESAQLQHDSLDLLDGSHVMWISDPTWLYALHSSDHTSVPRTCISGPHFYEWLSPCTQELVNLWLMSTNTYFCIRCSSSVILISNSLTIILTPYYFDHVSESDS